MSMVWKVRPKSIIALNSNVESLTHKKGNLIASVQVTKETAVKSLTHKKGLGNLIVSVQVTKEIAKSVCMLYT